MGGFYLAYENDYTDILLPSILHPCKSSLRGRGFSPTQRGRSVKNRSTNRKDKSNSVAKGGPKEPVHEHDGIHERNGKKRSWRANGHNLFNARRSIHPSTRPIILPLVPTGVLGR